MVETTFSTSHGILLSAGVFVSSRNTGVTKRPSARIFCAPKQSSSVGISFIAAMAARPDLRAAGTPILATAFR